MDAVKNDIKKLIDKELDAANEVNRPFASMHEAYAVIKEELEEAEDEYEKAGRFLHMAWINIKHDNAINAKIGLADVYNAAMNLAVEAVQVAAMCKKAQFMGMPVEEEKGMNKFKIGDTIRNKKTGVVGRVINDSSFANMYRIDVGWGIVLEVDYDDAEKVEVVEDEDE